MARQRGFAGARGTDYSQHFTRLDLECDTAQDGPGAAGKNAGQRLDRKATIGPWERQSGFMQWIRCQKDAHANECDARRHKRAP